MLLIDPVVTPARRLLARSFSSALRWRTSLQRGMLGVAIAATAALTPTAHAGYDWGYSFDTNGGADRDNKRWMKTIGDDQPLTNLSIPGTHDSGTWTISSANVVPLTQRMSIERQLNAGVRALDLRCRYQYNDCWLFHGPDSVGVDLKQNLAYVLKVVTAFLDANPSETVLFVMNNPEPYGAGPTDGSPNNNTAGVSFTAMFQNTYWNSNAWGGYFWKGRNASGQTTLPSGSAPAAPTLGEVRGKVVVMQDFGNTNASNFQWFGIPGPRWSSWTDRVSLQNAYKMGTNWDLYSKWEQVKNQLINANAGSRNTGVLYQNWLNGSGGSFPYFVASGKSSPGTYDNILLTGSVSLHGNGPYPEFPRVSCLGGLCSIGFWGTNVMTYQHLAGRAKDFYQPRAGMVMADFPDLPLIEAIIALNQRQSTPFALKFESGGCLDVNMANFTAGQTLQVWQCNGTPAQKFVTGTDGSVRPVGNTGLCLDATNGQLNAGTRLQLWTCNGTDAQKFKLTSAKQLTATANTGLCVDAQNASSANGTAVNLWTCNGGAAQRLNPAETGAVVSELRDASGGSLCLDARGGSTADGTLIQLWTCNNTAAQRFVYHPIDGSLRIDGTSQCLDATGGSVNPGTRLQLWACNGSRAQQFDPHTSTREWRARGAPSLCIDVQNAMAQPGTPINLWHCNGTNAQRFGQRSKSFAIGLWNVDDDVYVDVNGRNVFYSASRNPGSLNLDNHLSAGENVLGVRLGNKGCFASSLNMNITLSGTVVAERGYYTPISHCGWQADWKYRVNTQSGEVTQLQ